MAKKELILALRNAVEHGSSLDSAKNSFINAGYNKIEVEQAARQLSSGVFSMNEQESHDSPNHDYSMQGNQKQMQTPIQGQTHNIQENQEIKPRTNKKRIILLASILGILIIGLILTFLFVF